MKLSVTSVWTVLLITVSAQSNSIITWFSTTGASDTFSSSIEVRYGNTPITPVPTSTAPIALVTSYINEAVASRNINRTSWLTVIETLPVEQRWQIVYTAGTTPPPTITVEGTATERVWMSPTIATVTFSQTTCTNGADPPKSTSTVYTGEYTPFPGQIITTKTLWPTAVTIHYFQTLRSRVFTFTGTTTTFTSTATGTTFLSTSIVGTRTQDVNAGGRYYTRTRYSHTVTETSRDDQLAYATKPVQVSCDPGKPATVTRAARCAPTNIIKERDGHGMELRVLTDYWTFPVGFPGKLLGIPGMDASECCQLCVDNEGCAVSAWEDSWSRGCNLYFFKSPVLNDTCGSMPLEYFADVWALPEQANFVQVGCGSLKYLGRADSTCPFCKVDG